MQLNSNQALGSNRNLLLPEQTNLNTFILQSTTDGKTLENIKGTNATLTGISMANYDGTNDFTGGTFPAGFTKVDAGTKLEFTIEGLTIDSGDNAIIELGSLGGTGGNYQASGIGIYSTLTSGAGDGQLRLYVQENDATFISDRFGGTSINDGNPHTISVEFPTTSSVTYTVDGSATTVAFSAFDNAATGEGVVSALSDSFPTNGNLYTLGASRNIGGAVNGSLYSACKLSNVKVSQGSDVIVHLPLAEGSGTKAFDISGNGAHGSHTGTTYSTHDGIASHNHLNGFSIDSGVKIPALTSATKQVIFLDGTNDYIDLGTDIIPATNDFEIDFTIKHTALSGTNHIFSQFNFGSTGRFLVDATAAGVIRIHLTSIIVSSGGGVIAAGDKKSIRVKRTGTTFELLVGDDFDNLVSKGTATSSVAIYQGSANSKPSTLGFWTTGNSQPMQIFDFKLTNNGTITHNYDFQNNVGTTTILDSSGNSNNGTLVNATLSSAWAERTVDSSGTIVSADYALGNTSITNPSGYVHNNSECGLDLITTDVSASDIASINNASATQTFAKRDATNSDLVIQLLQYSSALSDAGELARTRAYVG